MNWIQYVYQRARRKVSVLHIDSSFFLTLEKIFRRSENFWWKRRKFVVVDCFGDCHVSIFRKLNTLGQHNGIRFRTTSVNGATVFGIENPNSQTNAFNIFTEWLSATPHNHYILFLIGEVDLGFLIWWKAKKTDQLPEALLQESLIRYKRFLLKVVSRFDKLIVCSAPLPTIKDGELFGNVANARREVNTTQKERTKLTLQFNRELKHWAKKKGIRFLDFDRYSLNPDSLLIREEFLNKDKTDHHYYDQAFISLILRSLEDSSFYQDINLSN